jgi:hypothetical protein
MVVRASDAASFTGWFEVLGEMMMATVDLLPLALESEPLVIARIQGIEAALAIWAGKTVEFSFNSTGTDLFSIHELSHSYARRAIDLATSIRLLLQEKRIVPATILGRALIETIATGCFFLHEIHRLIAAGDRQRIHDRLGRFYAGVKGGTFEPVNVMDAMRYLERVDAEYVAYLDDKYGLLTIAAKMVVGDSGPTQEEMRTALSALKKVRPSLRDRASQRCGYATFISRLKRTVASKRAIQAPLPASFAHGDLAGPSFVKSAGWPRRPNRELSPYLPRSGRGRQRLSAQLRTP